MTVHIERILKVEIPEDQDFGAPFFDDGPGYKVVRVARKSGLMGRLPGRLGEKELTRIGGLERLSLAKAREIAQKQAESYGGNWIVRESEREFP